jgi:hypothetical protein
MPFRNTKGIVTEDGDPDIEADVIVTAAALGFAASVIEETKNSIRLRSSAYTVGGVLILDAVTLHKAEIERIISTLAAG